MTNVQAKNTDENQLSTSWLAPLSDLFEHIKDSKFNVAEAASQFENELKRECEKYECKEPTNDFP